MLNKWLSRFHLPQYLSGYVLFFIFTSITIINLIVVIVYVEWSSHEEELLNSARIVSRVVNALDLMNATPENEWEKVAKIIESPDLLVSITAAPLWPLKMENRSIEQIKQFVTHIPTKLAVSIRLRTGFWLNFRYIPQSNSLEWQIFIISLSVMVALFFLMMAVSLLRFTVPLQQFKKAAEQLGVELRAEPIIAYGPSIVQETAFAMNQMQKRILDLLQDRNLMLAAISHDLRTPITRLKLAIQFLEDKNFCLELTKDLDEMEQMINQILTYTKDAAKCEEKRAIDLSALLLSICDEKSEQGYFVECEIKVPRLVFTAQPLALKRALMNLINNAVKYAQHVWVRVEKNEKQIFILIDDDGPGIPEAQLEKVFTPFYRVDTARSAQTGGTGLGLSIAQDVIHAHRGKIQLKNRPEGGLEVLITFEVE